ncbi:MAG TPA: M48 family metalloprotease [Gammaproteobacteria bacterium]
MNRATATNRVGIRRGGPLALLAAASVAAGPLPANELPDFGSPADAALSKSREYQLGRGVMLQLRNAGVVLDDPELTDYLRTLGSRLASHAGDGEQRFNFFLVNDPEINAFALPGGFIGVNTGLILASENESELAGVLAHEISHVTQRHIARALYDNQRTSIVSMAAMLAAILLGAATDMSSDAMQGVIGASQAMAIQRQINFTRANEYEADRIGMDLLSATGFDPNAMASFFEKIGKRYGSSQRMVPQFLQTHPVSFERVAEARSRARQLPQTRPEDSMGYALAKVRLEVLNAATSDEALTIYKNRRDGDSPADRYGAALAAMRASLHDDAERLFRGLAEDHPSVIAFRIGQAEAVMAGGAHEAALKSYAEFQRLFPRNVPLTISHANALIEAGRPAEAHKLLLDLLNNVPATPEQLRLIARAANAEGDVGNSYFYLSYYYASVGDLPLAIHQLRLALEAPDVNSVDRARFQARLDELVEYLPEEQRRNVARP